MISSELKNYVSSHMKNMDVVPVTTRGIQNFAADSRSSSSPSIEDLRKKYLSEDYRPPVAPANADNISSQDDDEIEVGLLRKKNVTSDDNFEDNDQRTIIRSKDKGILGSQG